MLRLAALFLWVICAVPGTAAEITVDGTASQANWRIWRKLDIDLALSAPTRWRVFTLDAPLRLVVELEDAQFPAVASTDISETGTGLAEPWLESRGIRAIQAGPVGDGWSRLVVLLAAPKRIASAEMVTTGESARLALRLAPTSPRAFAEASGAPAGSALALPDPAELAPPRPRHGPDHMVVTIDPGHGGIDGGAQAGGLSEAHLMLTFARELAEALRATGQVDVHLTRETDRFLPLDTRVGAARAAGADLLISLHADALAEGEAEGATIYTLDRDAEDAASRLLAQRHDRADLLAGVQQVDAGDEVALALIDMARVETAERSRQASHFLARGLAEAGVEMFKRPELGADFAVLRAADIPSVLVELGFLSSPRDRRNLADPLWRARAAQALTGGMLEWMRADAQAISDLRQ